MRIARLAGPALIAATVLGAALPVATALVVPVPTQAGSSPGNDASSSPGPTVH